MPHPSRLWDEGEALGKTLDEIDSDVAHVLQDRAVLHPALTAPPTAPAAAPAAVLPAAAAAEPAAAPAGTSEVSVIAPSEAMDLMRSLSELPGSSLACQAFEGSTGSAVATRAALPATPGAPTAMPHASAARAPAYAAISV